jgi:hypothetical protein
MLSNDKQIQQGMLAGYNIWVIIQVMVMMKFFKGYTAMYQMLHLVATMIASTVISYLYEY